MHLSPGGLVGQDSPTTCQEEVEVEEAAEVEEDHHQQPQTSEETLNVTKQRFVARLYLSLLVFLV